MDKIIRGVFSIACITTFLLVPITVYAEDNLTSQVLVEGDVQVNGILPEDTELNVKDNFTMQEIVEIKDTISQSDEELQGEIIGIYDISLESSNSEYQPKSDNNTVQVSIGLEEVTQASDIHVYHIHDDVVEEIPCALFDGMLMVFTDSFSTYVITLGNGMTETLDGDTTAYLPDAKEFQSIIGQTTGAFSSGLIGNLLGSIVDSLFSTSSKLSTYQIKDVLLLTNDEWKTTAMQKNNYTNEYTLKTGYSNKQFTTAKGAKIQCGWHSTTKTLYIITDAEKIYFPVDSSNYFAYMGGLEKISFITDERISFKYVEKADSMFEGCLKLSSVDLSNFHADTLRTTSRMFGDTPNTVITGLSNIQADTLTDVSYMFYNNSYGLDTKTQYTDIEQWDLDIGLCETTGMLGGCTVESLDLSNWKCTGDIYNPVFFISGNVNSTPVGLTEITMPTISSNIKSAKYTLGNIDNLTMTFTSETDSVFDLFPIDRITYRTDIVPEDFDKLKYTYRLPDIGTYSYQISNSNIKFSYPYNGQEVSLDRFENLILTDDGRRYLLTWFYDNEATMTAESIESTDDNKIETTYTFKNYMKVYVNNTEDTAVVITLTTPGYKVKEVFREGVKYKEAYTIYKYHNTLKILIHADTAQEIQAYEIPSDFKIKKIILGKSSFFLSAQSIRQKDFVIDDTYSTYIDMADNAVSENFIITDVSKIRGTNYGSTYSLDISELAEPGETIEFTNMQRIIGNTLQCMQGHNGICSFPSIVKLRGVDGYPDLNAGFRHTYNVTGYKFLNTKLTEVGNNIFYDNKDATDFWFTDNITKVGRYAFYVESKSLSEKGIDYLETNVYSNAEAFKTQADWFNSGRATLDLSADAVLFDTDITDIYNQLLQANSDNDTDKLEALQSEIMSHLVSINTTVISHNVTRYSTITEFEIPEFKGYKLMEGQLTDKTVLLTGINNSRTNGRLRSNAISLTPVTLEPLSVMSYMYIPKTSEFITGRSFATNVAKLIDTNTVYDITWTNEEFTSDCVLSTGEAETPIYARYNSNNNTIELYTDAAVVYLNKDSSNMFNGQSHKCYKKLKAISLLKSKIDTSNVETFESTFAWCQNVTELDLSRFNTSKNKSMTWMFTHGDKLEKIIGIEDLDTSNVTSMRSVFYENKSIKNLDLSKWNVSKVTTLYAFCTMCSSLETIDVSTWDVSNVVYMNWMFAGCAKLKELNVSNWNVSKVKVLEQFIQECTSITELDTSKWILQDGVNMAQMYALSGITSADLSNFNFKDSRTDYMFYESKITNFVGNSTLTNLGDYMFYDCYYLDTVAGLYNVTSFGQYVFYREAPEDTGIKYWYVNTQDLSDIYHHEYVEYDWKSDNVVTGTYTVSTPALLTTDNTVSLDNVDISSNIILIKLTGYTGDINVEFDDKVILTNTKDSSELIIKPTPEYKTDYYNGLCMIDGDAAKADITKYRFISLSLDIDENSVVSTGQYNGDMILRFSTNSDIDNSYSELSEQVVNDIIKDVYNVEYPELRLVSDICAEKNYTTNQIESHVSWFTQSLFDLLKSG